MTEQVQKVNSLSSSQLILLFNRLFLEQYNTQLVGGGLEPLYSPPSNDKPAEIIFTRDYFSSALHEIAHWCIAGEVRRAQVDYGYWYAPDGRTEKEQALFETVEVKPQAVEWMFSRACGHQFHLSADNLNGGAGVSNEFRRAVFNQVNQYCTYGQPERAKRFTVALAEYYGQISPFEVTRYSYDDVR